LVRTMKVISSLGSLLLCTVAGSPVAETYQYIFSNGELITEHWQINEVQVFSDESCETEIGRSNFKINSWQHTAGQGPEKLNDGDYSTYWENTRGDYRPDTSGACDGVPCQEDLCADGSGRRPINGECCQCPLPQAPCNADTVSDSCPVFSCLPPSEYDAGCKSVTTYSRPNANSEEPCCGNPCNYEKVDGTRCEPIGSDDRPIDVIAAPFPISQRASRGPRVSKRSTRGARGLGVFVGGCAFCGTNTVCTNGQCVSNCPQAPHACCQQGLSCDDASFTTDCVCTFDPFCCAEDGSWDAQCVSEAKSQCGLNCGEGSKEGETSFSNDIPTNGNGDDDNGGGSDGGLECVLCAELQPACEQGCENCVVTSPPDCSTCAVAFCADGGYADKGESCGLVTTNKKCEPGLQCSEQNVCEAPSDCLVCPQVQPECREGCSLCDVSLQTCGSCSFALCLDDAPPSPLPYPGLPWPHSDKLGEATIVLSSAQEIKCVKVHQTETNRLHTTASCNLYQVTEAAMCALNNPLGDNLDNIPDSPEFTSPQRGGRDSGGRNLGDNPPQDQIPDYVDSWQGPGYVDNSWDGPQGPGYIDNSWGGPQDYFEQPTDNNIGFLPVDEKACLPLDQCMGQSLPDEWGRSNQCIYDLGPKLMCKSVIDGVTVEPPPWEPKPPLVTVPELIGTLPEAGIVSTAI